jgi:hypothetical protein
MWKANGKTTTLVLFLDRLLPKIEVMCEMLQLETKHITEGKIRGIRRERRPKRLLDDLKKARRY